VLIRRVGATWSQPLGAVRAPLEPRGIAVQSRWPESCGTLASDIKLFSTRGGGKALMAYRQRPRGQVWRTVRRAKPRRASAATLELDPQKTALRLSRIVDAGLLRKRQRGLT
jgi:hypothetical protein